MEREKAKQSRVEGSKANRVVKRERERERERGRGRERERAREGHKGAQKEVSCVAHVCTVTRAHTHPHTHTSSNSTLSREGHNERELAGWCSPLDARCGKQKPKVEETRLTKTLEKKNGSAPRAEEKMEPGSGLSGAAKLNKIKIIGINLNF